MPIFIIRDCNLHYPISPSYFDNIQLVTWITLLRTIDCWQPQLIKEIAIAYDLGQKIINLRGRG